MLEGIKKIRAWQLADDLAVMIYQVAEKYPRHELYGLVSQMRRAAVSVPANIAEGGARNFLKEYRQFCNQAQGSLVEVEYFVHLSDRLGYLSPEDKESLARQLDETARTLHGLVTWIDDQIKQGKRTKSDLKRRA
jgi:four helix bundle protein